MYQLLYRSSIFMLQNNRSKRISQTKIPACGDLNSCCVVGCVSLTSVVVKMLDDILFIIRVLCLPRRWSRLLCHRKLINIVGTLMIVTSLLYVTSSSNKEYSGLSRQVSTALDLCVAILILFPSMIVYLKTMFMFTELSLPEVKCLRKSTEPLAVYLNNR